MHWHDTSHEGPDGPASRHDREWRTSVDALVAEADAAFGAPRLARQRTSIARRVAQRSAGVHARILRFPGAVVRTATTHPWRRRVAAAAIAGLLAGTAAGRYIFAPVHVGSGLGHAAVAPVVAGSPEDPRMSPGDEAFLIELDAALSGRPGAPLRALDALTPDGR